MKKPLDGRQALVLQRAMRAELARNIRGLKMPGHPPPYFISYLLKDVSTFTIDARYGALFTDRDYHSIDLYVDVRVGSRKNDQTVDGGLDRRLGERPSFHWIRGPLDLDSGALKYALWKLTHYKYGEALQDFYEKQKMQVAQRLKTEALSLSRETPVVRNASIVSRPHKLVALRSLARDVSALFLKQKSLVDPYVRIWGSNLVRVFVNSEGTRFISQERCFRAAVEAWYLTDDGTYLHSAKYFSALDEDALPERAKFREAVEWLAHDLSELERCEPLDPYAGPALLSGRATGLLFHEAIGHRLEGERLLSRAEGRTFADALGRRVLPVDVDIVDDPTQNRFGDEPLIGHFAIDDEGVLAEPVTLVERGTLKTFLLSRTSAPVLARYAKNLRGKERSNGHARQEEFQTPMARMSNLIVKAHAGHTWDEMKAMLLEMVRARGLPYGIIIHDASSGETQTDSYDFQAFKGVPTRVTIADPMTGAETRVRGINFIGTPLAAIQRIRAFGRDPEVDNSFCYAESGAIPVSTVAPPMLLDELELQRENVRNYRAPVLPPPHFRNPRSV